MSILGMDTPLKQLVAGNAALVVCMVLYLTWWTIVFKPGGHASAFTTTCIVLASLAGLAGVIMSVQGMGGCPATVPNIPGIAITVGGIVVYFALLAITSLLMKRQVTTELILIVGWGVLELSVINALYGSGQFSLTLSVVLAIVLIVAVVVFLVCYLQFYKLEDTAGWIDGMIPLATGAVYQVVMIIATIATVKP